MISARPIIDEFFKAIVAVDPDSRKDGLNTLNQAYYEISGAASWQEMRRTVSLSHGDLLPADLIAIDGVYDSDGNFYEPRDGVAAQRKETDPVKRFYLTTVDTPLARGVGLSLTKGSTTATFSPALSSLTNEWLVIPGLLGFWKLTNATTLASAWAGDSLQGQEYEVRPVGQKYLNLMTELGADDDEATVTVDYTAYPEPLTLTGGIIRLPSSEALLMKALRRYYKISRRDLAMGVSFNDEYDRAFSEMLARNPEYRGPAIPANRRGEFTWGSSPR